MDIKTLQIEAQKALDAGEVIRKEWAKANPSATFMDTDHSEKFDKAMADADACHDQILLLEKEARIKDSLGKITSAVPLFGKAAADPEMPEAKLLEKFLVHGVHKLNHNEREAFTKAFETGQDNQGGFFIGQQLSNQVLTLMKDQTFMRNFATVITINGSDSLGVPSVDTDPGDADWTGEVSTLTPDGAARTGQRELKPILLSKLEKVSQKLARTSPAFLNVLLDRLSYKHGLAEDKGFITGTGVNQPLGIFTASANGISTARDVTTASAGALVADDVIDTFLGVKGQYALKGTWAFSRTVLARIRKMKDTNGAYTWVAGFAGTPGTVCDRPYQVVEHANAWATTANTYLAVFGDMSQYWIAESAGVSIQRLDELYAANNQIGYIMRREVDGMPVQAEAFARLKMQ
jgi:HK97 family phage major capsid protein